MSEREQDYCQCCCCQGRCDVPYGQFHLPSYPPPRDCPEPEFVGQGAPVQGIPHFSRQQTWVAVSNLLTWGWRMTAQTYHMKQGQPGYWTLTFRGGGTPHPDAESEEGQHKLPF